MKLKATNYRKIQMKWFLRAVLVVLVLLACVSGLSKVMLVQREVEFFGQFGFTTPILLAFGLAQLAGGILLCFRAMRIVAAVVVLLTFLISAALLVLSAEIAVASITLVFVGLSGLLIRQSLSASNK
jgi:hypothetical protein